MVSLILCLLFLAVGSAANAVMDKISFHFDKSIFWDKDKRFWNPAISWINKWKDGDPLKGESFWGSSRWFVSLTDAWHRFKSFQLWCYAAAVAIIIEVPGLPKAASFIVALLVFRFVMSSTFVLFFNVLLVRRHRK